MVKRIVYCWFILVSFVLIGCENTTLACCDNANIADKKLITASTKSKREEIKDGAPLKPLPILYKNIKPKNEPLSRYGNPASYAVRGKRYHIMRTARGYKTKGLASWYGSKFHSQRTSSGEGYDMYAMTAAHRTLPLPTYVRVKNLSNGREAIVKVNDRGPFHSDRVIDLSYAAASKLGLLPKGTALVEIEALSADSKKANKSITGQYYVQAGAFNSVALAKLLQEKLTKVTSSPVFIEKYKKQYIVQVGPFATKYMSDKLKSKLAQQGVKKSIVMLR